MSVVKANEMIEKLEVNKEEENEPLCSVGNKY